jgi:hypothetical protein
MFKTFKMLKSLQHVLDPWIHPQGVKQCLAKITIMVQMRMPFMVLVSTVAAYSSPWMRAYRSPNKETLIIR